MAVFPKDTSGQLPQGGWLKPGFGCDKNILECLCLEEPRGFQQLRPQLAALVAEVTCAEVAVSELCHVWSQKCSSGLAEPDHELGRGPGHCWFCSCSYSSHSLVSCSQGEKLLFVWGSNTENHDFVTAQTRKKKRKEEELLFLVDECVHPLAGSLRAADHVLPVCIPLPFQINEESEEQPQQIPSGAGAVSWRAAPTAQRCLSSLFPPAFLLFHKMAMQSNHLPQPQVEALSSPLPSCSGRAWGCQKQGVNYIKLICTSWGFLFNLSKTPELKTELG